MEIKIFYDMDNTLAEMSKQLEGIYSGWLKEYNHRDPKQQEIIVNRLHEEGFFQNLTVIRDSVWVLKRLVNLGYYTGIISQPMINNYCIDEKNYWLNKYFPFIPRHRRIYTFDKYLLANFGRVLVDDNIHHLREWQKNGGIAICFQRGYNKEWNGITIKSHREIFQILHIIGGDK